MEYQRNSTRRIGGYNNTRNNQIRITPEMSPFATTNSCGCGCVCGNSRESRENSENSRMSGCGCGNSRESRENSENSRMSGCGCGNSRESRENGGNSRSNGCGCGNSSSDMDNDCRNSCLRGNSLAMVYSPCQRFENIYDTTEGLCRGTIFRDLDKPFWGGRR